MGCQDCSEDIWPHLEVHGVHMQLVAVQFTQLGKYVLDVIQVLDGVSEGGEHLLAMSPEFGIALNSAGTGEVPEFIEEPPGPGQEQARCAQTHTHSPLAPQEPLSWFSPPPPAAIALELSMGKFWNCLRRQVMVERGSLLLNFSSHKAP
uniref:Uncharacterized protein n=1 Tax=Salvator merianae TaxID=96440 RepID=A0A8D0B204_SALMN